MAENIITALSKFRWFFVTARNSTITFKGTAIDVKQVGRELDTVRPGRKRSKSRQSRAGDRSVDRCHDGQSHMG